MEFVYDQRTAVAGCNRLRYIERPGVYTRQPDVPPLAYREQAIRTSFPELHRRAALRTWNLHRHQQSTSARSGEQQASLSEYTTNAFMEIISPTNSP